MGNISKDIGKKKRVEEIAIYFVILDTHRRIVFDNSQLRKIKERLENNNCKSNIFTVPNQHSTT